MRTPSYRKHACGQAIVKIKGKTHYLGLHGSTQSKEKYRDVLAKYWRPRNEYRGEWPTIEDLLARFLTHAQQHYAESNEVEHLKLAMRPLRRLYGEETTDNFGPLKLKRIREAMVAEGLTRQGINKRIVRLRRIFNWGCSEELVPGETLHQLQSVRPLAEGRTKAPEAEPIEPVPQDHIDLVLDNAPEPVAAMIELQLLCGCRPGEVCALRRCDIDTGGKVWIFRPPSHKNRWRGTKREIYIGPKAIEILKEWLPPGLEDHVFSPRRYFRRNQYLDRYTTATYRTSIKQSCKKAGIPTWGPGALRHNAATRLKSQYGWESARVMLGHSTPDTTAIYSDRDRELAERIAMEAG